nr:nuclear transport factor 2 family protein [uncultured Sphingomonas sp.]
MWWMHALTGLALVQSAPADPARPDAAAHAQDDVRSADAAFWDAFNRCDRAAMGRFFSDDAEFYHDQTGVTRSRGAIVESLVRGPCGTPGLHLRRAVVADSVQVSPVPGFGAVMAGRHVFYAKQGNAPEVAATEARFTAVWQHRQGRWEMTRVVSYDHQPAPYVPPAAGLLLSPAALPAYAGTWQSDVGPIRVTVEGDALVLSSGSLRVTLGALTPDRFFARERDLQFQFSSDRSTITVEEKGKVVARGRKAAARL